MEISQGTLNLGIAPGAVFPGQFQNEFFNFPGGGWTFRFADPTSVVFPGDEPALSAIIVRSDINRTDDRTALAIYRLRRLK